MSYIGLVISLTCLLVTIIFFLLFRYVCSPWMYSMHVTKLYLTTNYIFLQKKSFSWQFTTLSTSTWPLLCLLVTSSLQWVWNWVPRMRYVEYFGVFFLCCHVYLALHYPSYIFFIVWLCLLLVSTSDLWHV